MINASKVSDIDELIITYILSSFLTVSVFLGIKNLSSLFIPIILASSFGYFLVNSLNFIPIDLQFFIRISNNLILLSANGTLSNAPGASNFL